MDYRAGIFFCLFFPFIVEQSAAIPLVPEAANLSNSPRAVSQSHDGRSKACAPPSKEKIAILPLKIPIVKRKLPLKLRTRNFRGNGYTSIESTLSRCAACHGGNGNASNNKAWPKLAAQNAVYLFKALKDFLPGIKHGRTSAAMNAMVVSLSEKDMLKIANYYAALPGTIETAQVDLISLGQRLYRGGDLAKGIPACLACHGPAGLGNPPAGFPRLSGQHSAYVVAQLKLFRAAKRDDKQRMMSTIAKKMSDADIEAVASYVSGLYY